MCGWVENGPQSPAHEEQRDPIRTSSFHLSEGFPAIPTYFKVFHIFCKETVYYF